MEDLLMLPKFNKTAWAERYCKCIDLDELERRLEFNDYYRKKSYEERDHFRWECWIAFIITFIVGTVVTFIVLTVGFAGVVVPILLIKALFK